MGKLKYYPDLKDSISKKYNLDLTSSLTLLEVEERIDCCLSG